MVLFWLLLQSKPKRVTTVSSGLISVFGISGLARATQGECEHCAAAGDVLPPQAQNTGSAWLEKTDRE